MLAVRGAMVESYTRRGHTEKTCQVCGKILNHHEGFAGKLCSHWKCRWKHLDNQLREHRSEAARVLGVDAAETYKPVVVPAWGNAAEPLSPQRRREFRDRMAELAEEAGRQEGAPATREPTSTQGSGEGLLSRVCAVCEGACCYEGRDVALHDAESFRWFLATSPGMTAATAVEVFLSHLPESGYAGSCVYHTTSGCALPPAMRAPICVVYECRGLKDLREHFLNTGQGRGFVVVRHDGRIVRSAFIDAETIRNYPPREPSRRPPEGCHTELDSQVAVVQNTC